MTAFPVVCGVSSGAVLRGLLAVWAGSVYWFAYSFWLDFCSWLVSKRSHRVDSLQDSLRPQVPSAQSARRRQGIRFRFVGLHRG